MDQAADPGDKEQNNDRDRIHIETCFNGQTP